MVSNPGELEVLCGDMMGAGATSIHESNFLFSLAIVGVCRNFIEWWQGAKVKFGIKPVTCRPRRRTLNTEQRARTLWGWWWWWWWLSLLTSCCEGRKERCLLWYFLRRGFSENERWVERDVGVGGVYIGERGWRKDARDIKKEGVLVMSECKWMVLSKSMWSIQNESNLISLKREAMQDKPSHYSWKWGRNQGELTVLRESMWSMQLPFQSMDIYYPALEILFVLDLLIQCDFQRWNWWIMLLAG